MTLFKMPTLFSQLFRVLTLRDMSIVWWTLIAFFWLLGFVSNFSLYTAHLILFFYYYLRLLPAIAALLTSSYGRLLFSRTESKLIPYLLITVITLLSSPGVVQYTALSYPQALFTLFCSHLILHAVVFAGKGHASGLIIFPLWLVMFNPQWFLQTTWLAPVAQPLPMLLFYGLSLAAAVYLPIVANRKGMAHQQQPEASWRFFWRAIPKFQPSLGACFLFQYNAQPLVRLLLFSMVCAAMPLLQSSVHFWFHSSWQWFPELDWKLLSESLFFVPLLYWLIMVDSGMARTKAAWLHLPLTRQQLFYFYEGHFLKQLLIFSLPLMLLLYFWQPDNPHLLLSGLLLLSKLLLITYLVLCFYNNSSVVGFTVTFILYASSSYKLFLASETTQLYSAVSLLLGAILLRYFAIKRWKIRNYSHKPTYIRNRHV